MDALVQVGDIVRGLRRIELGVQMCTGEGF